MRGKCLASKCQNSHGLFHCTECRDHDGPVVECIFYRLLQFESLINCKMYPKSTPGSRNQAPEVSTTLVRSFRRHEGVRFWCASAPGCHHGKGGRGRACREEYFLGVASISILNPGIRIFSGNHQKPRGNSQLLRRTMVKKNGESTPRNIKSSPEKRCQYPPLP